MNMFKGQGLAKPRAGSLLGALVVAAIAVIGSRASPLLGYGFALLALVMIIVAMLTNSIWASQSRKENPFVFSLFWGLMLGLIVPYLVTTFMEGGASAIYEMLTSAP